MADAVLTHDAFKKWYFASRKYKLLEVGVYLMFANQCENSSDVDSMDFHIRQFIHCPALDEHVIKISGCEIPHRSQQIVTHPLKVAGALLNT